ncbi:MAG TPA: hypothetical protein DCK95_06020, partial [Anaerolineaceae bacterium]|nr:hypothetical protein [Anaerolineaceae bacterium]
MKSDKTKKRTKTVLIIVGVIALVALIFALSIKQLPVRVLTDYSFSLLWEEGTSMHECAECHETEEFHSCSTCHDEHGSVELPELYFYNMIELTGDIPEVIFIPANHFFSYSELPNTYLTVDEFMEKWEVPEYESFTIYTRDGEFVSIAKEDITDNAMFLPYEDGIRFASEDLHVSTWAKGIAKFIIVSEEKPLRIGSTYTSIGRLLLGKTTSITIEEAKVMFKSEEDGQTRQAVTSSRVEGAALEDLLDLEQYDALQFTLQDG